jgi:sigma-B regulation protein RsbU (phosphoserine phosphatase)
MRVSFLHSVPARLAGLILLLGGATLLVLTELNRRAVERLLLNQAQVQAAASTAAVVDGLDGVIGSVERLVKFVARDLEGRPVSADDIEKTARNVVIDNPNIYGCSLAFEPAALTAGTARLGVYVHRSASPSRFVTRDLTAPEQAYWTRDDYRTVLDRAQTVWSEPYFDRGGTDRNVVRVSAPVFRTDGGARQPVGVVSAIIDLDWLRRLANVQEFADSSFTLIFSRTGRLIIHPKPTYVIAETIATLADKDNTPELVKIQQAVAAKRQGALRYTESNPTRTVYANYRPSKVAGWGVIVGYDESDFLQPQHKFRRITALFLSSLLLLVGAVVIVVTRTTLRPLGLLAAAADEIGRQNLDCEVPAPGRDDEIGRLTRAFAGMRDALKAQRLERRWAAQSLEHQLRYNQLIIDSIGELVFVLTKALNISRVNPAVLHGTGHTEVDLIKSALGRWVRLAPAAGQPAGPATELLLTALKEGRSLRGLPALLRRQDGTEISALLTLAPLRDNNRVVGGVVTLRLAAPGAN